MKEQIIAWGFGLINAFAPAERMAAGKQFPGWEETVEQKVTRYNEFASDLHDVVYDPSFVPFFPGKEGRARSFALMLAIAYHESGFAKDVDIGPCYQYGKESKTKRCDDGRAVCSMQVHVTFRGKTKEGFTKKDLWVRKNCFTAAANKIRQSLSTCTMNSQQHRLAAYGSGRCAHGLEGSRRLWKMYERFWGRLPAERDAAFEERKVAAM
jgi:hypothetical protein